MPSLGLDYCCCLPVYRSEKTFEKPKSITVRSPFSVKASGVLVLVILILLTSEAQGHTLAIREGATNEERPESIQLSLAWGKIDEYVPLLLGNGDLGGLFDPFGGTTYDELRYGSGRTRDIRTLHLTRLVLPDYWVLEDQKAYYFDPRFYRPTSQRTYLAYGAPFEILLRPEDPGFPDQVRDHRQTLDLSRGVLKTQYRVGDDEFSIETFVFAEASLLVYSVHATSSVIFKLSGIAPPPLRLHGDERIPNPRYHQTKNGFTVDESEDERVILKQVSNVFCPAFAVAAVPGAKREGRAFLLPAGSHTILVAFGHPSLGTPRQQALVTLQRTLEAGYPRLLKRHEAWWRAFWNRSYVVLPDKRIEQMWYRSLYYLASCLPRRVKSFSPEGGYGVFPAFAGFHPQDSMYHLFAALSSNHPELAEAQAEYLLETLPIAEAAARHIYYLDGARYPWQSTPGLLPYLPGHTNDGYYLHEHHVNGWVAEFVRRYLSAKGWELELTRRYYPILRGIARFFSSMLSLRGETLEITYVPVAGQEETGLEYNQKNLFDMLVAAKWSLAIASDAAGQIDVDRDERERWEDESRRLSLAYCLRPDGVYGSFEGDKGHDQKVPTQLMGVVMTSLFDGHRAEFEKTYSVLRRTVKTDPCSWSPGYYAIAAARLGKPDEALHAVLETFKFAGPGDLHFVENRYHVPGRMPYYLAAHALFVQAVNEMLLQDWSGEVKILPASPFREGAFKLRGLDRVIEVRWKDDQVEVLADAPDRKP